MLLNDEMKDDLKVVKLWYDNIDRDAAKRFRQR